MEFLNFFKKNKLFDLLLVSLFVLILEIGYLYYTNSKKGAVDVNGLKGYNELYLNLTAISDSQLQQNSEYARSIKYLLKIKEDKNKDQQYKDFQSSFGYLLNAYASSNNHKIFTLGNSFKKFAEENFPGRVKGHSFEIVCMDPQCADSAIPSGLAHIIDEVKQSQAPDPVKNSFINNLMNMSYISEKNTYSKAFGLLIMVNALKHSGAFTKLGLNEKLSNELLNFIKTAYPQDYKSLVEGQ